MSVPVDAKRQMADHVVPCFHWNIMLIYMAKHPPGAGFSTTRIVDDHILDHDTTVAHGRHKPAKRASTSCTMDITCALIHLHFCLG